MKPLRPFRNWNRYYRWEAGLGLTLLLVLAAVAWGHQYYKASSLPVEQPIPFSHRVHAGEKQISCLICHSTATQAARAGMPEVERCMLCHSRIIITYPPIRRLRNHYYDNQPIRWVRVNDLPDFVFFNHSVHLYRSIDCGHCHGNVRKMDRIAQPQVFQMGFCVTCHRAYNATHDCFTCHR